MRNHVFIAPVVNRNCKVRHNDATSSIMMHLRALKLLLFYSKLRFCVKSLEVGNSGRNYYVLWVQNRSKSSCFSINESFTETQGTISKFRVKKHWYQTHDKITVCKILRFALLTSYPGVSTSICRAINRVALNRAARFAF